jgi:hypothetical protein
MSANNVQVGGTINAYKTCGQAATVLHRPCCPLVRHRNNARRPDRTVLCCYRMQCGRMTGQDVLHAVEDNICYS